MQCILILTTFLKLFSTVQLKSDGCNSSEIKPTSSACLDGLGQDVGDSAYPTGTTCKLRRDNVTEIVLCTSRGWSIVKTNLDGYHHSRQKRFLWFILRAVGCFFFGCSNRAWDNTPPSMAGVCNGDIHATADKQQVNTRVSWPENSAYDDQDGRVSTKMVSGKSPGHHFWGVTKIAYIARDRSGNMATCSFFVIVKVIRCPRIPRVHDGYYICHPSDDMIYGAVCRFGCYVGHELVGGNTAVTCTQSGTWSGAIPRCQKIQCPRLLPSRQPLSYVCTDENRFRSICTFSCSEGYDITSGMSRVRVCTRHRTWRGSEPKCADIEPPKLSTCPGTVYAHCGRNSLRANVVWKEPSAKDNHDVVISVTKEGTISPGDTLSAGTYTVVYKAQDLAGNKANPCEMKVVVKVIRCPRIYPTPFQSVTCPFGTKYGSECSFDCELGSTINGTHYVVCEKRATDVYGYWTWDRNQPFCEVIQKCARTPNVPGHGALSCDNWFGGKFCQMFCKKGYDVSPGRNFEEMLTCGESGEWLPRTALPLPDCSRSISARYGVYRMCASYYFEGDCTNPKTILEIQDRFIQILKSSPSFESVCSLAGDKCSVENVQVRCGATRRRRSVEMTINFDLKLKNDNSSIQSLRLTQENISPLLEETRRKGELDIISNVTTIRLQSILRNDVKLICPSRTIASFHTLSCVKCSSGTFYDNDTQTCPQCEKGYYQDESGEDFCTPCPQNTTTKSIGSKDIEECIVACKPGSWSLDGTPGCSQCPIGTFSDNHGATLCKKCAYSLSTEDEGAKEESQCREFDLWFSGKESSTSLHFETVRSHNSFIVSSWLQRDMESFNAFSLTLNSNGIDSRIELNLSRNISLHTSRNSKIESDEVDNRWHYVILHISEEKVKVYIDSDVKYEIDENITLESNGIYEVKIQGKGKVSQFNIWSENTRDLSASLPEVMGKNRSCFLQRTGDILSWKEFENINSQTTFKQIPSECDDFDSCKSNPCINGNCQDTLDGFECHCHYGFYGERCDGNVDDCAENACENNSTCVDGASNYTCLCKDGFRGDLCEIAMVDGGWGRWGQWSQCSVTCGNGTQRRTRFCSDPAPDNGGLQCPGNASDVKMCSMEECTVCSNITATAHVLMICRNDSENTNCTLSCEEGYHFDHPIKPYYECGPDTYHLWDFKTSDNPDGKLPQCVETKNSQGMSFQYSASYISLLCDTEEKAKDSKTGIPQLLKYAADDINCIANSTCFLQQINVKNCHTRTKREAENKTVGFQIELVCDTQIFSSMECYGILHDALLTLLTQTQAKRFSALIQGQQYHIQPSSSRVQTFVKCPIGAVAADIYCVECSPGRYYKYDECVKCDYGTYQDESGKSSCKECPDGTTTPGRESRSIDECSVFTLKNDNDTLYIVVGILSTVLCIGMLSVTVVSIRKRLGRLTNDDSKIFHNVESKYDSEKPIRYAMRTRQK